MPSLGVEERVVHDQVAADPPQAANPKIGRQPPPLLRGEGGVPATADEERLHGALTVRLPARQHLGGEAMGGAERGERRDTGQDLEIRRGNQRAVGIPREELSARLAIHHQGREPRPAQCRNREGAIQAHPQADRARIRVDRRNRSATRHDEGHREGSARTETLHHSVLAAGEVT